MRVDSKGPRYLGDRFELHGGTGGLTEMCPAGDFLEVFKVDKTFRVYSPEKSDPEETNPDMPWVSMPSADVGSANKIVARVFIQASRAMRNVLLKGDISENDIAHCMHKCKEHLLICDERRGGVTESVAAISKEIERGLLKRGRRHYGEFPHVERLDEQCAAFLRNAKLAIQSLTELVHVFYGTAIHTARFDRVLNWFEQDVQHYRVHIDFLQRRLTGIEYIVGLRNYQEHGTKKKAFVLRNFALLPNETICLPQWHVTGNAPARIDQDMSDVVEFMLSFAEELFLICLLDNIDDPGPFVIREVAEANLDPSCPIRFVVEPALFAHIMKDPESAP